MTKSKTNSLVFTELTIVRNKRAALITAQLEKERISLESKLHEKRIRINDNRIKKCFLYWTPQLRIHSGVKRLERSKL